ncbi:CotH kinase family protein [Klebsiella pneumoniae]|uniref:CotH kinase family protein n=2 Tax=Klebsiella pneumoniae TaxID=573 RepID=UPI000E2B5CF0|nr:CotH kinase family protein [Klebsiella pneumoniae]EKX8515995.1 CotH kinase family protein [Klebsiella pneumoniae]ELA2460363.1 CotH kinase family protein [Klebsiella pneumoniae]MBR7281126.1 spore coat protein CotH [Klebsiella pneumoniae]MDR4724769.1 CotH kinase family protein [Klebsiella pneumoniae]SVV46394.1 putative prophage endo-N-neuraminidase [Klebsiella pneumoniae]
MTELNVTTAFIVFQVNKMNITEKVQWEDSVTLLTRQQKVEGGQDGAANIQAKELANRTAWLKSQLESIPDYREYTFYQTEDDPEGTITGLAGTPDGKIFRVAIYDTVNTAVVFKYYLNDNGVARFINDEMSAKGIEGLYKALEIVAQQLYLSQQVQASAIGDVSNDNDSTLEALDNLSNWHQRLYLSVQNLLLAMNDNAQSTEDNELTLQKLYVAQQMHAAALNEADSLLVYFSPENQLNRLMLTHKMTAALAPLEGFDPADSATASPPLLDTHFVFGEPVGIIRISVNSPNGVPPNKAAGQYPTTARIDIDGKVISFFSTFEVQGDTSATFPKKNLNITFSSTADRDEDMDLKIGDIIPHDEWTFKSNWIDNTHARQYASFLLWSQMMDSRRGWPKRDIDHSYTGKVGADGFPTGARAHPVGYPAVLYVNDAFYGIGTFAVGKKKENYNIPKNNPTQIHISMDANTAWVDITKISTPAMQAQYSFKAPKTQTEATQAALAAWDVFASSGQADFTANINTKMDKNNAIDFYLLLAAIGATDLWANNNTKNVQFITWDGVKWFFMPYDLDTTYGLKFEGTTISYLPDTVPGTDRSANLFWMKVRNAYGDDVNQRYADLRNQGIFSPDNLYFLLKQFQSKYSPDLVKADIKKWPTQPSLSVTSIDQILTWFNARLVYLDTYFNYSQQ